jgi:capsular exopolysaccharide synthesis family protein
VHVDSEDPQLAAAIANALCAAYLEQQQEIKTEATEHANKWLSERLTTLRKKAEDSARAVQAFKQAHNLTQTKGLTVSQQQLSELNSQLTLAAAARADKEASLHQLQDMLKTPGGADSAAPVLASPLIEKLQEQLATVRRTRAELGTRYLSHHPAMIEARAQERDLEKKIQTEVAKIVRAKESEAAAARAHEAMLRKQVHDLLGANAKLDTLSVQLDSLQHDADASNALYEDFLSRYKETSAQTDLDVPDARIAAAASPPMSPHFPKTRLFLGIAGMIALTIGVVAAFLLERLDNGLRSADQLERLASLNTLGLTPAAGSGAALLEAVVRDPLSLYTEAIRTIRSSLHYSHIENPPKILLVTSSLPGEGKTVFATSLARSVARSGEKVLLVDCDLRQPNVGRYFGVADETAGLTTIFEENATPERSTFLDKPSGLHVVPSGRLVSNPQDLLRSSRMSDFLDSKRDLYDLIVLDAPPVLAVSDALILSHLADATIFLVQWERTPRQAALGALKILRGGQGHIAGAVISQVNIRRHALYGYSDVGHYYGRYRNRRKAA